MGNYGQIKAGMKTDDLTPEIVEEAIQEAVDAEDWPRARQYVVILSKKEPGRADELARSHPELCDVVEEWVVVGFGIDRAIVVPNRESAETLADYSDGRLTARRRVTYTTPALFPGQA